MSDVLQYLLDLVTRLGPWSYIIIFIAAALECAAFAGLLVPGESLVLASGFLAHRGILEPQGVAIAAALGAIAGDNVGYYLAFFQKHGSKAVFIGRFIGFARALVPFVAGASRMRYRQFVAYDALGAVLWTLVFVTLGYVLGASWRVAEQWIGRLSTILAVIAVVVVAAVWHRRRQKAPRHA